MLPLQQGKVARRNDGGELLHGLRLLVFGGIVMNMKLVLHFYLSQGNINILN